MPRLRAIILWCFFGLLVRPVLRLVFGVTAFGRGALPRHGPAVILANHNSHLDAVVLMSLLPLRTLPRVRPVAAVDYFGRGLVRPVVARWCMNALLVERRRVRRGSNPLPEMLAALDAGDVLILFPEGTRGEPETLGALRSGIAHLVAARPDVPVIPVYLRNLGFSLPRGESMPVPLWLDVHVGRRRRLAGGRDAVMAEITGALERLRARAEGLRSSAIPAGDR
ncbi:MAG: lysophospholipid acyltransferase family protein [Planctomycetota bacterium]|jgi:1-acyl-sn-glycerol-3-phosphate acyltransferase